MTGRNGDGGGGGAGVGAAGSASAYLPARDWAVRLATGRFNEGDSVFTKRDGESATLIVEGGHLKVKDDDDGRIYTDPLAWKLRKQGRWARSEWKDHWRTIQHTDTRHPDNSEYRTLRLGKIEGLRNAKANLLSGRGGGERYGTRGQGSMRAGGGEDKKRKSGESDDASDSSDDRRSQHPTRVSRVRQGRQGGYAKEGKAVEGQGIHGEEGSSGMGGGRGEGTRKRRECRGDGGAASGEGRGREEPETQRREKRSRTTQPQKKCPHNRLKSRSSFQRCVFKIKERHLRDDGEDVPAVCSICLTELRLAIDAENSLRQCPHCRKLLHTGCLRRYLAGYLDQYLDTRELPTCPNCKSDVAGYRNVGDDGYDYDDDAWALGDLVQNVEDDFDSDYEP